MNGKVVLSYFIGAVVGCLVTGYLAKSYYKRVADEEIESMKEIMKQRVDSFCEEKFEEKIDDIFEEKTVDESADKASASAEPVNYAAKYRGGGEVNDILDEMKSNTHPTDDGEIASVSKKKGKKKKGARIIKVDNYDGDPQYKKIPVYYFLGDDIVADEYDNDILIGEDGRPLGKVVDFVPLDVINKFGFKDNDDEAVIYIRNEDIMYDFEVIKDFGTFADIKREE